MPQPLRIAREPSWPASRSGPAPIPAATPDALRYRRVFPLRASSLADLLDCPARWKAVHLDGLRSCSSPQARFGTAVHAGLANFDRQRLQRSETPPAELLAGATTAFAEELAKPEEGLVWEAAAYEKYQTIGLTLLQRYAEQLAPHRKFVAIEAKCPSLDLMVEGVILRLTGSLDRVREDADKRLGITDYKTGEQAVRADGTVVVAPHRPQLGMYEILGGLLMGEQMSAPAEIIGMQSAGPARIGAGDVHGAAESLLGTEEAPGTLVYVARVLREGAFFGNAKSLMCSKKFCPAFAGCRFRE